MGMFTNICHPETGMLIQIKFGREDFCDAYEVGDSVPFKKGTQPGTGRYLDGVYSGLGDREEDGTFEDYFVAVKDHKIHSVYLSADLSLRVSEMPDMVLCQNTKEQALEEALDIHPYKVEWWTESEWAEQRVHEYEEQIASLQERLEFERSLIGKSDEEIKQMRLSRIGAFMSKRVFDKLREPGFASRICSVKPIDNPDKV